MQDRPSHYRTVRLQSYCWTLLVILGFLNAAVAEKPDALPRWKPKLGVLKNFTVEVPVAAGKQATGPRAYQFHMSVAGTEFVDGRACWKLVFFPGDRPPPESAQRIAIFVDGAQRWPRKVVPIKSTFKPAIDKIGDAMMIVDGPPGVPLDILPSIPSSEFRDGPRAIEFHSTRAGNEIFLELIYAVDGREKLRLRQRWMEGEDWWRYYEKHVDGKLVLRARSSDAPPLDNAFAKLEQAPPTLAEHPLRQDKRLYGLVQVEPKRPSVAHLLRRIKAATGLEVEVAPELAKHVPDLGFISPSADGYFAWQLMEHLAKIEIENGRWEPTSTGYRLAGISKVPPNRELVTSDDQAPLLGSREFWLLACGVALVSIALLLVLHKRLPIRWSKTNADSLKRDEEAGKPAKK